jgi:NAD(P)-dependent dehydrogenase (short-subunit alcohol dehydrogenase family)
MTSSREKLVGAVTGAGSGIGRAVANKFGSVGADVAIVDVNPDSAQRAAAEISDEYGVRSRAFVADLSDPAECRRVFDEVCEWGEPNYWINNAGILRLASALDTSDELFDQVMDTNFRSVFVLSTAFAARVIARGDTGSIVNISSIHAVLSEPNAAVYTAAKGAIEACSRTFASEWAPLGVRVNSVRPGATYTELTNPIYSEEIKRAIYQRVPMRRIAEASEIAEAVYFLASDLSSYCTGTTLDVDGGYIMDGSLPDIVYGDSDSSTSG